MKKLCYIIILLVMVWGCEGENKRNFGSCLSGDCKAGEGIIVFKNCYYVKGGGPYYYLYPNNSKYIGGFDNYYPNGYGKLIYPNGDTYEGNFVNGRFHGKGLLRLYNGKNLEGIFENGQYVGKMIEK